MDMIEHPATVEYVSKLFRKSNNNIRDQETSVIPPIVSPIPSATEKEDETLNENKKRNKDNKRSQKEGLFAR